MKHRSKQNRQSDRHAKRAPDTEHNQDQTNEGQSSDLPAAGGEETAPRQPGSPG